MSYKHREGSFTIAFDGLEEDLDFIDFFMEDKGWSSYGPFPLGPLTSQFRFHIDYRDRKNFRVDLDRAVLPLGLRPRLIYSVPYSRRYMLE